MLPVAAGLVFASPARAVERVALVIGKVARAQAPARIASHASSMARTDTLSSVAAHSTSLNPKWSRVSALTLCSGALRR